MNTKENVVTDISLKEILAVIVRSGNKIIIGALIAAVLFGALGALSYYVLEEDPDKEYNIAHNEYEQTKANLETTIERSGRDAANQQAYNEQSQLMQIDPYNKKTTTMIFAISGINMEDVNTSFEVTQIPISYVTSQIQAQYLVLWEGLDLTKIVEETEYNDVPDKYLREVMTLTVTDGGVITLTVVGDNTQTCEQIAQSLYEALQQSREAVVKASYEHEFAVLSDTITRTSIDLTLEQLQQENAIKLEEYQMKVVESQRKLLELQQPSYSGGLKGIIVDLILGAVVGVLLMCVWVVCAYLIKGKVSGAKQMSARYALPHFGSMMSERGLWVTLGSRAMGEKIWKDEQQAQSYIRESCLNHLPESGAVAIVSSLDTVDEAVRTRLVELLSAKGHKVTFAADVAHNPEALAAIAQSEGVVLAECAFTSANAEVKDVLKTVKEFNKPVYGFVML